MAPGFCFRAKAGPLTYFASNGRCCPPQSSLSIRSAERLDDLK